MRRQKSVLVTLVKLIDALPWPPEPTKRPRGRPKTYSDRLMVKALVIMIIRRLYTAYALLAFLEQDDPLPQQLRPLLDEHGRFPSRRTWERRLATLPQTVPGLIGCCGRHLVALLRPWARHGRAVAFDSTALELTVANRGDHEVAPLLRAPLPGEVRYVLGDTSYNDPELRRQCHRRGCELVATRRGPYPHRDGGVEVRKVFHTLRSQAIEPFNGLFKHVFAWRVKMPVKGLQRAQLLALGAVVIYQLVLRYQHEHHLPLGKGVKPLLRVA